MHAQDFIVGLDPTGQSSITGAQLAQLVNSATVQDDKGLIIYTQDVAGSPPVPLVPNALSVTKWQRYIWIRFTGSSISVYVWNPSAAIDNTYIQWVSLNSAGIAQNSITGGVSGKIALNTIEDVNISSVNWSKLVGGGALAGGDLGGTFPAPYVNSRAITGDKIALSTILANNIALSGITADRLSPGVSIAGQVLTNIGGGQVGFANPTFGNNKVLQTYTTALTALAGNGASTIAVGTDVKDNTAGCTAVGNVATLIPLSSVSKVLIEGVIYVSIPGSNSGVVYAGAGVFIGAGVSGVSPVAFGVAAQTTLDGGNRFLHPIVFRGVFDSPGMGSSVGMNARFWGSAGLTYANSMDGSTKIYGGTGSVASSITVTEYLP